MATDSISGVSANLGQDQFLQLLIAQLQNQDPLNPTSNTEFIAQLAQFSSVQGIQSLNANFSEMLKLQQLTQGANLVGKNVDYRLTSDGPTLSGNVGSVAVQDGKFLLQVGGASVALDQITAVRT